VRAARADAEAADRQLWEQEHAVSQAKATSASLTQQLQDLVMFQRRCEANMEEAAFVARSAQEEVEALRKRVAAATASMEQARGALDASTSVSASAAQEKAQLEARLREIQTAGPVLATGSVPETAIPAELLALRARVADAEQTFAATPSWADWARVQDDGIDTVNLSWGGWAGDSTPQAASVPPQQAPVT
jgi:chromosome segregation ATPase